MNTNEPVSSTKSLSDTCESSSLPLYSVVIPVYRSAPLLPALTCRLEDFFVSRRLRFELIFVNDGSPDNSWQVLEEIRSLHDHLTIIDLMRNYGQHSAVFCGLQNSRGDFVITMDDDLQNPPEEIDHLIIKVNEGYDVVFGEFQQKMHHPIRRWGSKLIGWLNKKLFDKPAGLVLTNFRIMRREVIDAMCGIHTTFPYIPGLILLSAKSFANISVRHEERSVGKSNYNMRAIAKLVWRILFNYSAFPLRLVSAIGTFTAITAFLLGCFFVVRALFVQSAAPGWPTLVALMSFYQGITLVLFAALGEYVVRIVNDVSGRKSYQVRAKFTSTSRKPSVA